MGEAPLRPVQRDSRLDVARGLAIIAVVLVHVVRGLNRGGLVELSDSATVDRIVGLWCLSVFAFVSGTLVQRPARQHNLAQYVGDRTVRLFVVYVLWSLLQGGVMLLAAGLVNGPTSIKAMVTWTQPTSQLWYLPFLIVVTLVCVPLKPWMRRRAPWILAGSAVISAVFWGYDGGYVGTQGLGLVFFFVAGMALGTDRVKSVLDRWSTTAAAVCSIATLIVASLVSVWTDATLATAFWETRTWVTTVIGIVLSLVASAALLVTGHALRSWTWLALVGRRSLDIYLAHIILASGTRIVLVHLGVTSVWALVVCSVATGVLGSLAAGTVLRRYRLGWLFDGVSWLSRKPRPVTAAAHRA